MNILCFLGWHQWTYNLIFKPKIKGKVITEYITKAECKCCGKTERRLHLECDGKDMLEMYND